MLFVRHFVLSFCCIFLRGPELGELLVGEAVDGQITFGIAHVGHFDAADHFLLSDTQQAIVSIVFDMNDELIRDETLGQSHDLVDVCLLSHVQAEGLLIVGVTLVDAVDDGFVGHDEASFLFLAVFVDFYDNITKKDVLVG